MISFPIPIELLFLVLNCSKTFNRSLFYIIFYRFHFVGEMKTDEKIKTILLSFCNRKHKNSSTSHRIFIHESTQLLRQLILNTIQYTSTKPTISRTNNSIIIIHRHVQGISFIQLAHPTSPRLLFSYQMELSQLHTRHLCVQ